MIKRALLERLSAHLFKGKAIILTGPRQVGKTTLLKEIANADTNELLFLDGDDPIVRNNLTEPSTAQLRQIIGQHRLVFIDEAQRIRNIGITLKIIIDQFPDVQLLVSGSSALDLHDQINEPLTGRKWAYQLYPISWSEFEKNVGFIGAEQQLETRLIYGMYPDVINNLGQEKEILQDLSGSYLYKDVLSMGNIKKPDLMERLLQALALQVGNEVSYNELANLIRLDKGTVVHYMDLLEKSFVIFRLSSFSRNLRNEIKENRKVYFYDNGIRNALLGTFGPLDLRQDKGALWENFLVSERKKYLEYNRVFARSFFWRTRQQQEVDYVEELDGRLHGFEFKWKATLKITLPKLFTETYQAESTIVDRDNFRLFLGV